MVLRVCTDGLSGRSQKRAKYLDKWKTDWFHEISNLFTLTTDQVGSCVNQEDHALATSCGSVAASKYQARSLQNRAKMSMVISMVERYVKGELSVDKNIRDDVILNDTRVDSAIDDDVITPWMMVKPTEICPTLEKDIERHRSLFHNDTSVDCETLLNFQGPLDDLGKLPDHDILAQACESLHEYTPKALETSSYPVDNKTTCQKQSAMTEMQQLNMKHRDVTNVATVNEKKRKRSNDYHQKRNDSNHSDKMKVIESIPATLPDGRVVRIELTRNANTTTPSNGGKITHVLLPITKSQVIEQSRMLSMQKANTQGNIQYTTGKVPYKQGNTQKVNSQLNPTVSLRNIAPLAKPNQPVKKTVMATEQSNQVNHKKSANDLKNTLQVEGSIDLADALENLDDLNEIMSDLDSPNADNMFEEMIKTFAESEGSLSPVDSDMERTDTKAIARVQKFPGKTGPQDVAKVPKVMPNAKKSKKKSADYDAKNPFHRPPIPYNIIIYLAFKHLNYPSLTVQQLYKMIIEMFPYFKLAHSNWQNAIRHQLCCCKVYEKIPLCPVNGVDTVDRSGGKSAWRIRDEECIQKLRTDTINTLGKPDNISKIKIALNAEYNFYGIFGEFIQSETEIIIEEKPPTPPLEDTISTEETISYEQSTSPDSYVETLSPSALENLDFGKYIISDFQTIAQQQGISS